MEEILQKYPVEPNVGFDGKFKWIAPNKARTRNAAFKRQGIKNYKDELGHRWQLESDGKKGTRWRNLDGDRRPSELSFDPRTGKPGTRFASLRARVDRRVRTLLESNKTEAKINKEIRQEIANFNKGLDPQDPNRLVFEHRFSQADWKRLGIPGNPADSHNIWVTTAREAKQKTRIESTLRTQGKNQTHYVDFNPETRSFHVLPINEFKVGKEALGGLEIPEAEWSHRHFNPKDTLNKSSLTAVGRSNHLGDRIESTLNQPFDANIQNLDPTEYEGLGVWHDAETLEDSWIKIQREINTDSGKFNDATGEFIYAKDPTARTSIDIQSKIGQGQGKYSDIINLKNKFHNIKRSLPAGEYYLHADNYTKAMYYLREFKDDPWVSLSGEYGGQRINPTEYKKYPTLKLTVPDKETRLKQAVEGPYPDWQKQGVPKSSLSGAMMDDDPMKTVSSLAKKHNVQMSAVTSDLGTAMRRAGSVLPFIGAGLDAWDVQQRWEEMIDNPNEGFTDYMDKVQFGLASATLGTSFWAEPANFVLGMTNLGIDVARTIAEEDKRNNFMKNMRAIGRGTTHIAQQFL
ncbi:hypothetical protein PRUG_00012 [Prochlorococcus phage P-SSP6]|uniref:Uncharacterized protein n=2 Tax=Tangaroavirus tv951510a TaxID=2733962 RepID=M1PRJ5_9CAUD|nr:hypothetical protein CYOG_00017 [Cyanophage 9515-10a]ADP00038.1 predicted protein [Cyanophage 9515-10a]AGF91569.1 hypothetical protein PRUG_00012 [Prochlorococcus phage P-SSP6]